MGEFVCSHHTGTLVIESQQTVDLKKRLGPLMYRLNILQGEVFGECTPFHFKLRLKVQSADDEVSLSFVDLVNIEIAMVRADCFCQIMGSLSCLL